MPNKWLITGANGNLGRRLIQSLLSFAHDGDGSEPVEVIAVVRSSRAAETMANLDLQADARERLQVITLDYTDATALAEAAQGARYVVHLVGILKEGGGATYQQAHEDSCLALVDALSSVEQLVYLSIVGSSPDASNACLASKGRAEEILMRGAVPSCVIRVPMVLGEGDYASFALAKRARARLSFTFRAESLEQPIYAGDVVGAIQNAALQKVGSVALDFGGPEVLTRKDLSQRAAHAIGRQAGAIVSLPIGLGLAFASLLQAVLSNPPITTSMLGVLDHDDNIDIRRAQECLGLDTLTPLDQMLKNVL